MKKRIYWELFSTFFKIGLFTFGGGYELDRVLRTSARRKSTGSPTRT